MPTNVKWNHEENGWLSIYPECIPWLTGIFLPFPAIIDLIEMVATTDFADFSTFLGEESPHHLGTGLNIWNL